MDFTRDPENFINYIAQVKRDWTRASSEFLGLVDHWQDLSLNHFAGMTAISAKERSIEGEVLGKQFSIELSPISVDKAGFAEAVLFLHKNGAAKSELGRFNVRRDGSIFNSDGSLLLDSDISGYSYRIFSTVLHAVIEAPVPVDSK
ncbi:hypothetical protein I1A_002837 [Pseudomonas fluorescens R124]|uniref:Uncharacterized protein n=1 Tax=Pseudomonas fluorescens R124 TaxID=743713 RepID=A0A7U9GSW8_PSEFL|nr:hypothetical protein [Pseudomonas fluorescens]EJZ58509.1 hypothetical protein I1A_002837 [Pseudomonas fluorescens R124]